MNKKIASEIAIGIIILIAIVFAGISWLESARMTTQGSDTSNSSVAVQSQRPQSSNLPAKKSAADQSTDSQANSNCTPHYYEGNDKFSAWYVSESDGAVVIAIKKEDVAKLPVAVTQIKGEFGSSEVKLIDPTDAVVAKLKASSAKKPAMITLQGFAEVCQSSPLVSLEKATVAFKNKS